MTSRIAGYFYNVSPRWTRDYCKIKTFGICIISIFVMIWLTAIDNSVAFQETCQQEAPVETAAPLKWPDLFLAGDLQALRVKCI